MDNDEVQKLLQEGIEAAKVAHRKEPSFKSASGISLAQKKQREQARRLLFQVTILDETNVQAWLWLSSVLDETPDKIACLENVLILEPDHAAAKAALARLQPSKTTSFIKKVSRKSSPSQPPRPINPDYNLSYSPPYGSYRPAAPAINTLEVSLLQAEPEFTQEQSPTAQQCPFCQQPISNSDIACPHCTLPLIMDCPACNTPMDVEWDTCKECGQPMGDYHLGSVYFTLLATIYEQYNRPNKSIDALLVAEKMNPKQPDLHRYLGELQAELGKINEAVITLQKAIELEPDQAGPYLALGRVLQKEGRWEEAEKVYRTAMKAIPQSSEPLFAMGDLMMQRGQLRKARGYLKRATRLDPNHGLAWAGLGRLYERDGDRAAAVRAYQQALKTLAPEVPEVYYIQERLDALTSAGGSGGLFDLLRKIVG